MAKFVINVINSAGYFGIVLLMFIENVFPPIPSEFIVPLAGYIVTKGELSLIGVIVAGTIGSVLGALPLYYSGRKLGDDGLKIIADRYGRWLTMSRKDVDRAKYWFDKYGGLAVLLFRLVPGLRSIISIPAGIDRMSLLTFLLYTTLGTGLWTTLLACSGFLLGKNFTKIEQYLNPVSYVVLGGIAIMYIVRVLQYEKQSGSSGSRPGI